MQAIVKDNWRFLSAICLILADENIFGKEKWGKKRINDWIDSAAEMCETFNEYDREGIYRYKLDELERRHGEVITRARIESVVMKNTTLKRPAEIKEIIDNVLLEMLMTVNEFDKIGRKKLIEGLEGMSKEQISSAPERLKEKYGVEIDTSFNDYKSIMRERKGKNNKMTYKEQKEAMQAMEIFRAWSDQNNPEKQA